MTIKRLLPNAQHISEFAYDPHAQRLLNGTCTQASAAMCFAAATGTPTTAADVTRLMIDMRDNMFTRGEAQANGAATIANMSKELRNRGAQIALEWDFGQVHDWHAVLLQYAGIQPILLQVANAQGITDAAGIHEDAGVQYHAIAVLGEADTGYVVGDPNNPTIASTFDIYPYAALSAAQPCGLIMLKMTTKPPVTPTVPPPPAPPTSKKVPAGWSDDGTTLKGPPAPDGKIYPVSEPFRSQMIDLLGRGIMTPDDMPLTLSITVTPARREVTTLYHRLVQTTDSKRGTEQFLGNLGSSVLVYEGKFGRLDAMK